MKLFSKKKKTDEVKKSANVGGNQRGKETSKNKVEKPDSKKSVEPKIVPASQIGKKDVKVRSKLKKVSRMGKLKKRPFLSTAIAAGFNILGVVASVVILGNLSQKALELKQLRNAAAGAEKKKQVEVSDLKIASIVEKSQELTSLFPDEPGLINFVKEIEKLKNEGSVTNFSFANQEAVRDQTKVLGFPFMLRFSGSWEQVGGDLEKLQKLPYLTRAVNLELKSNRESSDLVEFRYGGFIYVNESFSKD